MGMSGTEGELMRTWGTEGEAVGMFGTEGELVRMWGTEGEAVGRFLCTC